MSEKQVLSDGIEYLQVSFIKKGRKRYFSGGAASTRIGTLCSPIEEYLSLQYKVE